MLRINWINRVVCVAAVCASLVSTASADTFGSGANQFSIDFVTVSGPRNPASGDGIVPNNYRMGIYEISNDQWAKFAASVGVPITGAPAAAYDDGASWVGASLPATMVSWYEAAQFVNWLNTDSGYQPAYRFTGVQGTASYSFSTWSIADAAGRTNLFRHKDAEYYLPTEDEWIKAGFWNGTVVQSYATPDGTIPIAGVDTNYNMTEAGPPWNVDSGSVELNGTFNIMGNAWEWTENPYVSNNYAPDSTRSVRGGDYHLFNLFLTSFTRTDMLPDEEVLAGGFRVASGIRALDLTPGDADLDGDVDLDDFVALKSNFGTGTVLAQGDFDGDNDVDLDDFIILKGSFGTASVPEPGAMSLLALWGWVVTRRRRR